MHAEHLVRRFQHPPKLKVKTESVKPVITTMYTGRYQVFCHRCECATSATGVFFTVAMAWWVEYDIATVQ